MSVMDSKFVREIGNYFVEIFKCQNQCHIVKILSSSMNSKVAVEEVCAQSGSYEALEQQSSTHLSEHVDTIFHFFYFTFSSFLVFTHQYIFILFSILLFFNFPPLFDTFQYGCVSSLADQPVPASSRPSAVVEYALDGERGIGW